MSAVSPLAAGMPAITARGLSKAYGRSRALAPLDLDVQPGERVALFGPNGAGKSTLIRVLATALRPTGGGLWLSGVDAAADPAAARACLGLVSHQTYLYPDLTAAENLRFYAGMFALTDASARVVAALARVGLAHVADRRVRTFSRGMQQRLSLARATLHRPPILLLDEPDSGLDAAGTERLAELLGLATEGTACNAREARDAREAGDIRADVSGESASYRPAVVLASHNHELGRRLCARVLHLERGALVHDSGEAARCA